MRGGTGQKLHYAATITAGVASLIATVLSIVSIWLQTKNYRKPLLQRYVVRILLMVPIYSISSWASMVSTAAASWLDPIRDIYEAFTIYTFLQLMVNYLGGERNVIIMTHGRPPVKHLWPLDSVFPPVDISDPHTFLLIKRGILQYTWLKPILALATIIMKATGVYQEGYIGLNSGYFWSGIIYNISVTISLYSLGMFWVCMHNDLKPFRPVPKFLCVKLIIFASYWQGFLLSVLVWLGAIPDDVQGYTPDNLAAAIQDALICFEMPIFAVSHWYAFSWHDYATHKFAAARMPVWYALRDAFGPRDLIEDSKETFAGDKYEYRYFDSAGKVMAHEDSRSRLARLKHGMRYERGGKAKYWLPKPDEINATVTTPLLSGNGAGPSTRIEQAVGYSTGGLEPFELDDSEEELYEQARKLEFGDWNYPVITINDPGRESYVTSRPVVRRTAYSQSSTPATSSSGGSRQKQKQKQRQKPAGPPIETVVAKKPKAKPHVISSPDVQRDSAAESSAPSTAEGTFTQETADRSSKPTWYDGVPDDVLGVEESRQWSSPSEDVGPTPAGLKFNAHNDEQNVWGASDRQSR